MAWHIPVSFKRAGSLMAMNRQVWLRQLTFICVFLLIGTVSQLVLFKTDSNSWTDALLTKQWLWVLYFVVSHVMVERLMRKPKGSK